MLYKEETPERTSEVQVFAVPTHYFILRVKVENKPIAFWLNPKGLTSSYFVLTFCTEDNK